MATESRFYVRHQDGEPANDRAAWRALPAISCIRDRLYCCRDGARIMRRDVRHGGRSGESVAAMRWRAEETCAEWNREYERSLQ